MGDDADREEALLRPLIAKSVPLILSAVIAFFSTTATHKVETAKDEASHNDNAEQVLSAKAAIEAETKERKAELEARRKQRDAQIRALEDRVRVLEAIVDRLERRRER